MSVMRSMFVFAMLFEIACTYLPEEPEISSGDVVVEETGDYILLSSNPENLPQKAFVFIPGGFVDPHAYNCWLTDLVTMYPEIAVILIKVPSNLAIVNAGKIEKVMKSFDNIDSWVIGGHSLGGVVSVFTVYDHPEKFDGLILLASWATESTSLREWDGHVLNLYGSNDGLATVQEIEMNIEYLPPGTSHIEIEGGNHSGFGCYGFQKGDLEAGISKDLQQEIMVREMINYFEGLWD